MTDTRRPELTDSQRDMLMFIEAFVAEKKYPPSMQEIADGLGIASRSTVFDQLMRLKRKGYIEIDGGPRTLRVVA